MAERQRPRHRRRRPGLRSRMMRKGGDGVVPRRRDGTNLICRIKSAAVAVGEEAVVSSSARLTAMEPIRLAAPITTEPQRRKRRRVPGGYPSSPAGSRSICPRERRRPAPSLRRRTQKAKSKLVRTRPEAERGNLHRAKAKANSALRQETPTRKARSFPYPNTLRSVHRPLTSATPS